MNMRVKVYCFLAGLFMLLSGNAFAQSVIVSSPTGLNSALADVSVDTITFSSDITMNVAVSAVSSSPNKTIEGSGFTLDGVGATNRYGFSSTAADSTFSINDLTITNFRRTGAGGALSLNPSSGRINFYGSDLSFISNTASTYGGGAYLNNTDAVFEGNISFTSNIATSGGGAIAGDNNSKITFDGPVSFTSNNGGVHGGAIYASDSEFIFNDSVSFTNNIARYGGAIANFGSTLTFNADATFSGNVTASHSTARGGTIYAEGGVFNFNGITTFDSGFVAGANGGGAIHAIDGSEFYFNNESFFTNNGTSGNNSKGAAIALTSSTIVFSTVTAKNNVTITHGGKGGFLNLVDSTAIFQGAAYIGGLGENEGNWCTSGGGIYAGENSYVLFEKEAFFEGNQALGSAGTTRSNGAAIYADGAGSIIFQDNVTFNSNNGLSVFYSTGSSLLFEQQVTFTQNTGTALNTQFSNAVFEDTVIFDRNFSTANGGAIISGNSSLTFNGQVIFATNTASSNGGAIYLTASAVPVVFNDAVSFIGNRAEAGAGGAVFSTGGSLEFNGSALFSNNYSKTGGGAVYMTNAGNISFGSTDSDVLIAQNNISEGNGGFLNSNMGRNITFNAVSLFGGSGDSNVGVSGGAIFSNATASTNSYITFNADATFDSNVSTGVASSSGGGAIWGSNTNLNFGSDVAFRNNTAENSGGAVYLTNASTSAFDGSVLFENNVSSTSGGALYAGTGVNIDFNGDQTSFYANTSTGTGGAVFATGQGSIIFGDSSSDILQAYNNISFQSSGGFVSASGGKEIIFNSTSSVYGNIAELSGGALYGASSSIFNINGYMLFQANKALSGSGGAVSLYNSFLDASPSDSEMKFFGNTAGADGGAMHFYASQADMNDVLFAGNSAANGGALSLQWKSSVNITSPTFVENTASANGGAAEVLNSTLSVTNAKFINNSAGTKGGAVFVQGNNSEEVGRFYSNTVFKSDGDSTTVFGGNTAGGASNALYLDIFGEAHFHTEANTSVEFYDGIAGSTFSTVLGYSGEGDFNLYGAVNGINIHLSAINGGAFNMKYGSSINSEMLTNDAGSKFIMNNGAVDSVTLSSFINGGTLGMDIFSTNPETNDTIIAERNVTLSQDTSSLEIIADFTDSNFRKKIYKLIYYGETLNGEFGNLDISTVVTFSTTPVLSYGTLINNWITLTLEGFDKQTNFSALPGLTFNQRESAKALDRISSNVTGGSDMDIILGLILAKSDGMQKQSLSDASGYFLSNVIRNAATGGGNNGLYDRIKNNCAADRANEGIWAQLTGSRETFFEDENSIGDYNNLSTGFMAGFDKFIEDRNLMLGVYGKYSSEEVKQSRNTADGFKTGLGFYGGLIKEKWELKTMLSGNLAMYDTSRYIKFMDRKAKADIDAFSLNVDVEGAMKFELSKIQFTNLRPYIGLGFENVTYGDFKEKGADALNLYVESGNYLRSSARGGMSIVYDDKYRWNGYAGAEMRYLITGNSPEIESVFAGTDINFKSRGSKEGRIECGIGLGGSVRVYKELKLFVNGNYSVAERHQNFYGNAGARYTFCGMKKKDYKDLKKAKEIEQFKKLYREHEEFINEYVEERIKEKGTGSGN